MPPKPIIAAKLPSRLPTWRPTPSCWASSSANERRNRPWANRSDPLDKPDESLTWDLSLESNVAEQRRQQHRHRGHHEDACPRVLGITEPPHDERGIPETPGQANDGRSLPEALGAE